MIRTLERPLAELDGDLRTLLGLWAATTAAHRGLVTPPPAGHGLLADWWQSTADRLATGVPSALYVDPEPLEGPVIRRVLDDLSRGAEEGLGLVAAANADPGVLGDVYAGLGTERDRKHAGRFYTPAPWVEQALPPTLAVGQRVLDPACGGGRFLLGVLERLAPGGPSAARAEIAEHTVYGVDADPLAVAICQAALHLACATPQRFEVAVDVNVEVGDPLLGLAAARMERGLNRDQLGLFAPPRPDRPELGADPRSRRARMRGWRVRQARLFDARRALIAPSLPEGARAEPVDVDLVMPTPFDVVVGNPPYRGGRHSPLPAADDLYRRSFAVAEYQLDPYALFLELALECLAPGGTLAMVVPNAWMSNLKAGRLRRLLVGEHGLQRIIELPAEVFGAGVETVVVQATRGGRTPEAVPVLGWAEPPELPIPPPTRRGCLIPEPLKPEAPLPLPRDPRAIALLLRSRQWRTTLGDVAELTRGVNPYHKATHTPEQIAARVHHADHKVDDTYVPELKGRDLGAYRLWWSGRYWISYGPWLKEPRDPRFFEGPRLLVRKVLGETLCGAYTEASLCCDQSVYIARLLEGQPWPPGALLAIVNSEVVTTLLRARHQEDDRLFPQLKVAELRGLPLPPVDPRDPSLVELSALALELQDLETAYHEALVSAARAQCGPEATPQALARVTGRLARQGWPEGTLDAPEGLQAARERAALLRAEIDATVAALYGVETEDPSEEPPMSTLLAAGDALPAFSLTDDRGQPVTDADFAGETVVLYFYPKDDTPGCTKESCDFRDNISAFTEEGVKVYGISADSVESHQAFRDKFNLSFPLISDPEHTLCEAFGVWGEQRWKAHTYIGIARTTFVIEDKVITKVYPDVSVVDHAATVLSELKG